MNKYTYFYFYPAQKCQTGILGRKLVRANGNISRIILLSTPSDERWKRSKMSQMTIWLIVPTEYRITIELQHPEHMDENM